MIATGIFLFLLGTKFGNGYSFTSEVKSSDTTKVTITEEINKEKQIPSIKLNIGSPPFIPKFINQFMVPPKVISQKGITTVEAPMAFQVENIFGGDNIIIERKSPCGSVLSTISKPCSPVEVMVPPNIVVEPPPQYPIFPVIRMPDVPFLIEEPLQVPGRMVVSEINININQIPPPPQLPPLIMSEIPRPVLVEEKTVILIPKAPEFTILTPVMKSPYIPTLCARDIVLERYLPNMAFENTKKVELIPFPATRTAPVVTSTLVKCCESK